MRRRSFLTALGISALPVAGCSTIDGSRSPSATGPETDEPSPTGTEPSGATTETTTPGRRPVESLPGEVGIGEASVIDLETAPRTYALTPGVYRSNDGAEVRMEFAVTATSDHPARLVASFRNANDYENTFELDWTPPFGRVTSEIPRRYGDRGRIDDRTYRAGLVLAPTGNHDLVSDPPEVELADDGLWRLTDGVDQWLPETVRLEPEETIHGEYAVVGRSEGGGEGRPPGVYEFSRGQEGSIRISVWETDAPGPADESRFGDASVSRPPRGDPGSVAWYHEADSTTPTYVRPSTERATLPAEIDFTFVNHAGESTGGGHWNLYKRADGEWFHVGPYVHTSDIRTVAPGHSKTWTLHAYVGEGLPCTDAKVFDYLGGGQYAAVAGYGHATPRSAALVELVGGQVSVTPTDDATAERTDGSVTVTTDEWRDDEHPPDAILALTRVENADDRLIAEQIMRRRNRGLRNALAFFDDDTDEVRLRTDEHVAQDVIGYESDARQFRFDGAAYEARLESGDSS